MQYLILLFLLLAGTRVQAQSPELSAATLPAELKPGANSVVRSYDVVYTVLSPSTATLSYRKVITLLNKDHGSADRLVEFYDDDVRIMNLSATSYDMFGKKVEDAKRSDITDVAVSSQSSFYEDSRVKTVAVKCAVYPCTVVFEVEKKMSDFGAVGYPHWSPQDCEQAVEKSTFTAIVPKDNELLYQPRGLAAPELSEEKDNRIYKWSVANLMAQADEPYAPSTAQTLPYLRIALADFQIDDFKGSFRNWKDFGSFMRLIMQDRNELSPQLSSLVKETVAGATTDRERISRLYRLLQERTRYVSIQLGIGGWQPFSAKYVEENRYGDCKALSNYMGAMLTAVGIESYPVVINWSDDTYFPAEEDFTSSAFNHMILYVPSEEMYLECTSSDAPVGYLGNGKQDRNVLWVTPQGGKLVKTPAHKPAENGHTRTVDLTLQPDGKIGFKVRSTFYGASQETMRSLTAHIPDATKQRKWFYENGFLPDVTGTDYQLTVNPDSPLAGLTYATELNSYARKMGKRTFLPINSTYPQNWVPEKNEDRKLPIVTTKSRFYVDTVNVILPDNLEVEGGESSTVTYSHAAGEYQSRIQTTENGLRWVRTLKLLPVNLPAAEYADFRQFYVDVARAESAQLVLIEKKTK